MQADRNCYSVLKWLTPVLPVRLAKAKDGARIAQPTLIVDLARSRRYRAKKMPSVPQTEAGANPSARTAPAAPPAPLRAYYDALLAAHGPQHWWPGRSAFEVIVGAILTQNTSWTNVEPAIRNLRREKLLTPRGMESVSLPRLARKNVPHSHGGAARKTSLRPRYWPGNGGLQPALWRRAPGIRC